jgi:hypothetical protein
VEGRYDDEEEEEEEGAVEKEEVEGRSPKLRATAADARPMPEVERGSW